MLDFVMTVIAVATFILGIIVAAITATWALGRASGATITRTDLQEINTKITEESRNYGEVAAALRVKIEQFELWVRDFLAEKADVENIEYTTRELSRKVEQLPLLTVKVDTMWTFMMDRGGMEAMARGYMRKESPLTLTDEGKKVIAPILLEVKQYCQSHSEIVTRPIDEVEIELVNRFRTRLINEICEPHELYRGACIVMLIEALRLEKVIN